MIKNDINIFLEKILSPKYNSFFFEHPDRNSINSEIDAVIVARKDTKEKALFLRERYKNISYPDNNGLSENNIIIKKRFYDLVYIMLKMLYIFSFIYVHIVPHNNIFIS